MPKRKKRSVSRVIWRKTLTPADGWASNWRQFFFWFFWNVPIWKQNARIASWGPIASKKKVTDDNLATQVETSRRMEDDSIENNKEAGKKHKLPYIMYSQMYILNIHNSLSFSIEKEREGKISFVCVICIQRNM